MRNVKISIMPVVRYFVLIVFLVIISCGSSPDKKSPPGESDNSPSDVKISTIPGYNLASPGEIMKLPVILHEVSGITAIDNSLIACIQDENGIIFFYDIVRKKITNQITFWGDGDFEGIALAGSRLFVLRSDGLLLEITNLKTSETAKAIPLDIIRGYDNEGLCFDSRNNRLLVAPKNKPDRDPGIKGERAVYGFDLQNNVIIKKALYDFDLKTIKEYAVRNKVFTPKKDKEKDHNNLPDIEFRPSAIAIHPLTGRLFVLSSADPMLVVFNPNGRIENMVRLGSKIFNMPEGITFLGNGDMLISNEGQNREATVIRINYKPD